MSIMRKLFFRNLSEEDYKQLVEINKKETKAFRKRPQFIAGLIFFGGLMFYFAFRAFVAGWTTPDAKIILFTIVPLLVIWIIIKYVAKASTMTVFVFYMPLFLWIGLMQYQRFAFNIEYLIYFLITFFGFGFVNDAITYYFCLRILEEQKKNQPNVK